MKKLFFIVSIALATTMFSCSNENEQEETASANVVTNTATGMDNLQSRIAEISDSMQVIAPAAQTRGFWKWLKVFNADAVGAILGTFYGGPIGTAIGAAGASAIAAAQNDYDIYTEEDFTKLVDFNQLNISQADSVGLYHNLILLQLKNENLRSMPIDSVLYKVEKCAKLVTKANKISINDTDIRLNTVDNTALILMKNSINRINEAQDSKELNAIFCELYPKHTKEINIIKEYIDGLSKIEESQRDQYTELVLKETNNADISDEMKSTVKSGVLVGNASSQLWK